jgi:CBS domain-containing protein
MLATDVMRTSFATIKPNCSVLSAVQLLLETDQRGLPVVNDDGTLVGMVSEGDFLHRDELGISPPTGNWLDSLLGVDEGPARARMRTLRVSALMSPVPITADVDASLDDIVAQMDIHHIAQVPVVSAGAVVGIVSRRELLAALAGLLREQSTSESTGTVSSAH